MYTKQDFSEAIKQAFLKRELTAALFHAGDPRLMQVLESSATMFSMLSQQIEVAMQEPFVKARDATVLADAALKGLLFTAKPSTVIIRATNNSERDIHIASGRNVIDASGRYYQIVEPKIILARTTAELTACQLQVEIQSHTVEEGYPFYSIEVEQPKDGSYISSLQVKVNGELFTPSYKFNGVAANDKVFHVESDEFKRLSVKFGAYSVIGTQPVGGDMITIEKGLTFGDIQPALDSPFSLQYIQSADEYDLKLEMQAISVAGTAPYDMATLRELVRYPSVYDENAVFLGEFDLLLRKHFKQLAFLNVWNEALEEQVRGANANNVNTLFISFALPEHSTTDKTAIQNQMKRVIAEADDSYKVRFVEPVIEKIRCSITSTIARIYDSGQVTAQIKDVLLAEYGKNAYSTKQGKVVVKHKEISDLLKQKIPALADQRGDFHVSVQSFTNTRPEAFHYMDAQSISVNLNYANYESNVWGGGYSTSR